MQKPKNSPAGTQRQSLDPHGGISNVEQTSLQSAASMFLVENITKNEISKCEEMKYV